MIVICFKLLQHPLRNSWGALSWYRPSQDVADAICTWCAWATETDKKTMQVAERSIESGSNHPQTDAVTRTVAMPPGGRSAPPPRTRRCPHQREEARRPQSMVTQACFSQENRWHMPRIQRL